MSAEVLLTGKSPADSFVETTHIVLPGDTNAVGTAFGGKIMQWIDIAAAVAAARHVGGIALTASMDSLSFVHPVNLGDIIVLRAAVNRAWRTSMEVGVRVEGERRGGGRYHAASAYLTFVSVDDQGKPKPVPSILPVTEKDRERFLQADARRSMRLASRARR